MADGMAEVVFVLGAGFNCSIVDPSRRDKAAPLANTFFQVLIEHGHFEDKLEAFRRRVYVDLLLERIERYWHLDLDGLRTQPFDVEECLTLFHSQLVEATDDAEKLNLLRAAFALRQLILEYLADFAYEGSTPAAWAFGQDVLARRADVLTFNYDTLAERTVASASGIGDKPMADSLREPMAAFLRGEYREEVSDDDLDASHLAWRSSLAHGFEFDEVALPIAGVPHYVEGSRYYAHPNNRLYDSTRVLKLHGSIDWLRYTDRRAYPFPEDPPATKPEGIVLAKSSSYWMAELPTHKQWQMDPLVITPNQYKDFRPYPFPTVWQTARESLRECETLVVVGYSFPATDFSTRRLFLEAFSEHGVKNVVVIDPNPAVASVVRHLTHFKGPVVTCDDLCSYYGVPRGWFEFVQETSSSSSAAHRST
jgi:hypothetical protein